MSRGTAGAGAGPRDEPTVAGGTGQSGAARARDETSASQRPATALICSPRGRPAPRPPSLCASRCARSRAPPRAPSTSAGRCPFPPAGLGKENGTGSACGYGRADPSLLRCAGLSGPKGVGDTVPAVPLTWGKEPPTPLPPQHSHAHTLTFFGTFPQRITALGSVMACACLVLGTASGLRPASHQLCELAQRRPLRVSGGFCSRAAVPARGGRRAPRPPECSRGPAARTGSRERHAQRWSQRSQSVPTPRSTAGSAFSQPKIRWILARVFSQRLSGHLPVGDWKDQRFALSQSESVPSLPHSILCLWSPVGQHSHFYS